MRRKLLVLVVLFLISYNIAYGKNDNKTSSERIHSKNNKTVKHKGINRFKRSTGNQFLFHIPNGDAVASYDNLKLVNSLAKSDKIEIEQPFWGTRGRRDSSSSENGPDTRYCIKNKFCYSCSKFCIPFTSNDVNDFPFWGNRGRRNSDSESDENYLDSWEERSRRQDDQDDPFWGSRGRRNEDSPFWGTRGRREHTSKSTGFYDDEDEPFWGNRGRRMTHKSKYNRQSDNEPFWGSRGKKEKSKFQYTDEEMEPFWGNRGRRKLGEDFFKHDSDNNYDDGMSKAKRKEMSSSFWANRGRNSILKNLFSGPTRSRPQNEPTSNDLNKEVSKGFHIKPSEQNTVHDDRIYAEEPYFILIERSSRSSMEDDPYIITRGKKYGNSHLPKAARDRRGAIEDIVKSVQNDPYYIARGKKDSFIKIGNTLMSVDSLNKDKDTICGIIDAILTKNGGSKMKRDVNDTERDRRTILKKLAAQLQADPYFVSRGKKDTASDGQKMKDFIGQIVDMCY